MEGMNWIRIGGIAALVLGSVYVLLPTFLGDTAAEIASKASSVQTTASAPAVDLDFEVDVTDGDAAAVGEALKARLEQASIAVSRVTPDGARIEVALQAGGNTDVARKLAAIQGERAVYAPDQVTTLPPPGQAPPGAASQGVLDALTTLPKLDTTYWSGVLATLADTPVPEGAAAGWEITGVERTDQGTVVTTTGSAPDGLRILALDGASQAIVLPTGKVVPLAEGTAGAVVLGALQAGPLPGSVTVVPEEAPTIAADDTPAGEAEEVPSNVPPWLAGILPDTRIPLGLDLQGGIDLTLQVELDEAILGQSSRDITYLKDAAAKEGLIVESVRRAPDAPVIEITTDAELSDVRTFVAGRLQDYTYYETDGRTHRFEMTDLRQEEVRTQAVEQVLETLRKRVDATGVKEPAIVKKGGGRINVQLPGMVDVEAASKAIGTTAVLEFRMVNHEFDDALLEQILDAAQEQMPEDQFFDDDLLNRWLWDTKRLDPDSIILWSEPGNEKQLLYASNSWPRKRTDEGVPLEAAPNVLHIDVPLTGNDVNDAGVSFDPQTNVAGVSLEFKPRGGQIFCDLTAEAVGKNFAIILDNIVRSAPRINERICGGAARISMDSATDPMAESQNLSLVLRTGALDAPVVIASVRQVGASLGADSIRQGTTGAAVGGIIVLVFMALWYRMAGVIADFALVVNVMLILAALAALGATLTLPGIAGIALTMGMAVDANIIIYERIREELRLGVQPRKAVDVGFEKAVVAVLDANITTAIAGIVLFSYGTGPIKGFAVTLLFGIVTTLVSALFVTRTVMELVTRSSSARLRI